MSTFYDILSISPNATEQEIRKAYRLQVMLYHPDKNPSPEAIARFLLVTQAYETLIDKNKRFLYDHNLGEYSYGQYYMPNYEDWMEQRRQRQLEEEEEAYKLFQKKRLLFQSHPHYTYRKALIYLTTALGYLTALVIFSGALYLISVTHVIIFFVLLPFLSGALILAYFCYSWYQNKKKLF